MDDVRVAVTLNNGRSHILRIPEGVTARDLASALRGVTVATDLKWDDDDEWLELERGDAWVRRDAVAELAIVDYPDDPSTAIGYQY